MELFERWQHTIQGFGVDEQLAKQAFTVLVEAYSSCDRYYHTLKHIHQVLSTIDILQTYTKNLAAVQLAAWFHDVIYDTQAKDNEERSAEYACDLLSSLDINQSVITSINSIIMNTKYHQAATDDYDSQVLLDADLAILAANPIQYQEYAQAIRQEYAWLPEADYIEGRRQVLERFLQRQRIYFIPLMFDVAEQFARSNLQTEIQTLLDSNC